MHNTQRRQRIRKGGSLLGRKSRDRGEGSRRFLWVDEKEGRLEGLGAWAFSFGFKHKQGLCKGKINSKVLRVGSGRG